MQPNIYAAYMCFDACSVLMPHCPACTPTCTLIVTSDVIYSKTGNCLGCEVDVHCFVVAALPPLANNAVGRESESRGQDKDADCKEVELGRKIRTAKQHKRVDCEGKRRGGEREREGERAAGEEG